MSGCTYWPRPGQASARPGLLSGCNAAVACSGYLAYEDIVKQLLDGDYYAMYSPAGVDNTQVRYCSDRHCMQCIVYNKQCRKMLGFTKGM
jgi:hypothetical protein